MKHLHISVDDWIFDVVEKHRKEKNINRSEATRDLLAAGIKTRGA